MHKEDFKLDRLIEAIDKDPRTQSAIAKAIGVHKGMFSKWYNRQSDPSLYYFRKICIVLKQSADHLLGLDGSERNFDYYITFEEDGQEQSYPVHTFSTKKLERLPMLLSYMKQCIHDDKQCFVNQEPLNQKGKEELVTIIENFENQISTLLQNQ